MRRTIHAFRSTPTVLTSCIAVLFSTAAFGWGPEGHRITGSIAEDLLTDQAKAAVRDLLENQTLVDVAVWADDVRNQEKYQWTAPLHYINAPRDATRINMRRDCENMMCVVGAIQHFTEVLLNAEGQRSRREQREALKFIVHFIGDLHQPMHVSYSDDRGGNRLRVSFLGDNDTNLHRVWDTDLIRRRMNGHWTDLAGEIRAMITDDHLRHWRRESDPVAWANESFAITRRIYAELPRDLQLGPDYYERNIGDALERLAMAGVRIAEVLNRVMPEARAGRPDMPPGDEFVDRPPAPGPDPAPAPAPAGPRDHVRIVEGDSCGRGDGKFMYLENTHESRIIRVRIRRVWTTPVGERSTEETIVVRPGQGDRRRLGCSEQQISRNEVRRFRWEILEAEFR
jgi:hypothetical protein